MLNTFGISILLLCYLLRTDSPVLAGQPPCSVPAALSIAAELTNTISQDLTVIVSKPEREGADFDALRSTITERLHADFEANEGLADRMVETILLPIWKRDGVSGLSTDDIPENELASIQTAEDFMQMLPSLKERLDQQLRAKPSPINGEKIDDLGTHEKRPRRPLPRRDYCE